MTKPNPDTQNLFAQEGTAILTDEEMTVMARNGRLISEGFDSNSLQTTSYDVRIGRRAILGGSSQEIDLEHDNLRIEPGSYAGVISLEKFKLPDNVVAHLGSKRKFSYDGLILLTGSTIDPAYEGHLLFGVYNASTRKVVLPSRNKICNVSFLRVQRSVKPIAPDPYLLKGEFPPDFLTKMANVDVMEWSRIDSEVKRIEGLTQQVVALQAKYNDVLEPIKALTKDVDAVTKNVDRLTEHVKTMGGRVDKLEDLYVKNAELMTKLSLNVDSVISKVGSQESTVKDIASKLASYGLLVKIAWAIILLAIGALVTPLLKKVLGL